MLFIENIENKLNQSILFHRMNLSEYKGIIKNKAMSLLISGKIDIIPCPMEMASKRIQNYTFTATLVDST